MTAAASGLDLAPRAGALFPALRLALAVQEFLATEGAARSAVDVAIAKLEEAEGCGAKLSDLQRQLLVAATRELAAPAEAWPHVKAGLTEILAAIAAEGPEGGRPGLRPLSADDPRVKAWKRACGEET